VNVEKTEEILIESVSTKLSLGVYIIDDYSGMEAAGNFNVSIKGQNINPIKNPSGYYLFLDLSGDRYDVKVNGGEHFFDGEIETVRLEDLDIQNPIVNVALLPKPSYKFPPSATLIRGVVKNSEGKGIDGALLGINESSIRTRTAQNGEFVIYLKGLNKDNVIQSGETKLVRINGKNPVLEINHPDYQKKKMSIEVDEGRTTSLSVTYP
jgi:hypothetical protein